MDAFFNDCKYAWNFIDSKVGEIGGVSFNENTSLSTGGKYGSGLDYFNVNGRTSTPLSITTDTLNINFWLNPKATYFNVFTLVDKNGKTIRFNFSNQFVLYHSTAGGATNKYGVNTSFTIGYNHYFNIRIDIANKIFHYGFEYGTSRTTQEYELDISNLSFDFSEFTFGCASYTTQTISLLYIFDRALNLGEQDYLYNSGAGRTLNPLPSGKDIYKDCFAYYKLDETSGTSIEDATGNNNDGVVSAGVSSFTNASGKIEKCFYSDTVKSGSIKLFGNNELANTNFTISFWYKQKTASTGSSTSFQVASGGYVNSNNYNYILEIYSNYGNNYLNFTYLNNGNTRTIRSGVINNITNWNFFTVTLKNTGSGSSEINMFVNGDLLYNATIVGAYILPTSRQDLKTLVFSCNSDYQTSFYGSLDELGFWKKALSGVEIAVLYNNGAGLPFESGPTYLLELDDTATATDDIKIKADYKVEVSEDSYFEDRGGAGVNTTLTMDDEVSAYDDVNTKVNFKVVTDDMAEFNEEYKISVYKNGIDDIWADRTKQENINWNNREKQEGYWTDRDKPWIK